WEGRKQWGALVNNTRHAAIKINSLLPDGDEKNNFIQLISCFPMVLKNHLRDINEIDSLDLKDDLKNELIKYIHLPNGLTNLMYAQLNKWKTDKTISDVDILLIDKEIKSFVDILGACERIKNTPIPFSYTI